MQEKSEFQKKNFPSNQPVSLKRNSYNSEYEEDEGNIEVLNLLEADIVTNVKELIIKSDEDYNLVIDSPGNAL